MELYDIGSKVLGELLCPGISKSNPEKNISHKKLIIF